MQIGSIDVVSAVDAADRALRPIVQRDWTQRGTGEWTCNATLAHVGDCLLSYAGQIVAQPEFGYVNFEAVVSDGATQEDILDFALAGGRILASVVQTGDSSARAFHPTGRSDVEGFAAMGCTELLMHCDDVARRFGSALLPAEDSCERILRRLFPEVEIHDDGAWPTLRWATGRGGLAGRAQREDWTWRGTPIDE